MTQGAGRIENQVPKKASGVMPWTAEVITSLQELESYVPQWNELLASSGANTIFLTWEWISAWCQTVYPDVQLFIVAVRDGQGHLMALAPLYLSDFWVMGMMKYKCLRILGDCHSGSDYPDIIVRRGFEDRAMMCLVKELLENHTSWDCIWIQGVAGWTSACAQFMGLSKQFGLYLHHREHEFCVIQLPETYEIYMQGLSRNRREQIRRKTRRLKEAFDVEFIRCDNEDELSEYLSSLFTLHRKRWESVGQSGSFVRRPLMKMFYEAFAPVALRQGWLRLYALKVDGVIRAVQYGYAYDGVFCQIQEGFEIEGFDGIGNVLRHYVIEACIEEGLYEYDFLGGFGDHKSRFGAKLRTGCDVFIGRKSFKNKALFSKEIWPSGRFIQEGRPACEGRSHG